jgi:uncharacterized protein (TIGR02996 family)
MAEHPGFLQAVLDAPDDDAPRLIYADWLDDHGDPARAEFIRLQCRPDPRQVGRAGALLGTHHARWLAPLLELGLKERPFREGPMAWWRVVGEGGCEFTFTRGFVSEIVAYGRAAARSLVGAMALVLARTPLESVAFNGVEGMGAEPTLQSLIDGPAPRRLRELSVNTTGLSVVDQQRLREAFGDRVTFGPIAEEDIADEVDIPF